jgi:hypothetical protein
MPRMADILVTSSDERPQLAVEVKNTSETSGAWAAQFRRNLLAHAAIPNTPYFMVTAFDHFYLWRQTPGTAPEALPEYTVDALDYLQPYYDRAAFINKIPTFDAMEILVAAWLNDLVRSTPPRQEKKTAWLYDSGLYAAIRDGVVRTQASV